MLMDLMRAMSAIQTFGRGNLKCRLATIEGSLRGLAADKYLAELLSCGIANDTLAAAGTIKELVGQINVVIHAVGILECLSKLLEPDEVIEYVSLGAGNTGRPFDLETNHRIAEFKFTRWKGGAEPIRQNAMFKDFYLMAEHPTGKRKYLYVLGSDQPLKFFNGCRALSSVLTGHAELGRKFFEKYGNEYKVVSEYYLPRKHLVNIEDISTLVPQLMSVADAQADTVS